MDAKGVGRGRFKGYSNASRQDTGGNSGMTFREAANGKDALRIVEAGTAGTTLVLADWNMPETNGLDLLKKSRSESRTLLRGGGHGREPEPKSNTSRKPWRLGANEEVGMKPFTRDILVEKLELAGIHP